MRIFSSQEGLFSIELVSYVFSGNPEDGKLQLQSMFFT